MVDKWVLIHGLKTTHTDLNGKFGKIKEYVTENGDYYGRYNVDVGGEPFALKPNNVKRVLPNCSAVVGLRVEISGLVEKKELNNKWGTITGFGDNEANRFTVKIDGKEYGLKPENVKEVQDRQYDNFEDWQKSVTNVIATKDSKVLARRLAEDNIATSEVIVSGVLCLFAFTLFNRAHRWWTAKSN